MADRLQAAGQRQAERNKDNAVSKKRQSHLRPPIFARATRRGWLGQHGGAHNV
jgi:hypothetical protein